ncbi:spermidine synthase [Cellulomonas sp. PhB150]|uniref:spermine/spermidine synthase domain-containing protein n=1 Tax=Cellulomonas sp. PhB150 TaxID=2485188 RepID=UPI000F4A200C|nr:spermidine synthase [Cellulomonas sp. PhB150]ROS30774.1 spermine/spermidine synthase [Cellulomonas sp. PhB150]
MPDERPTRRPGRARLEELDWQQTAIGAISLRRRVEPTTGREVHEVKIDDDFLMSSLFVDAEVALADMGLDRLADRSDLVVVVGGLGLGYTARAVLDHANVAALVVVDFLAPVIDWHRRGLVPLGAGLVGDPRCRLVQGDFFALAAAEQGFDLGQPQRLVDAILVDIDHSPRHLLAPQNAPFYTADGLRRLRGQLTPGGVFALWSNDPPDDEFLATLSEVFDDTAAHVVSFDNPLQDRDATNTVYVASA